jgi:8-oxo-dGTP pyrophosphatase MutT (NUDIX family)
MKRPATLKRLARTKRGGLSLRLRKGEKREVRAQFAALCWKRDDDGKIRVCLVTSRMTQRWILPKGWPMADKTPSQAAAIEAWEEAGLVGIVSEHCLGVYSDRKVLPTRRLPVVVMVYPLEVTEEHDVFPEHTQRTRAWMSRRKAAKRVPDPLLAKIVREFDPST